MALCALAQLFIVVTYPPLVRLLALETLGIKAAGFSTVDAGVSSGAGTHSSPPLLALLQGDREEICLGALVVLQVQYARTWSCVRYPLLFSRVFGCEGYSR